MQNALFLRDNTVSMSIIPLYAENMDKNPK